MFIFIVPVYRLTVSKYFFHTFFLHSFPDHYCQMYFLPFLGNGVRPSCSSLHPAPCPATPNIEVRDFADLDGISTRKVFSSQRPPLQRFGYDLGEGRFFDLPALPRCRKNRGTPKLFFHGISMRKVFSSDSQSFSHFGEGRIFDLPALPRCEKNRGSPKTYFLDGFATRQLFSSHPQTFSDYREGRLFDFPTHLGVCV